MECILHLKCNYRWCHHKLLALYHPPFSSELPLGNSMSSDYWWSTSKETLLLWWQDESLSCLMTGKYSTASVGCCLVTTSSLWASLPWKHLVFFGQSRMTWDWRRHSIQHHLWVRSGLYWTDGSFDWYQVEGAPATYPSRTSGQVSRGGTQYELGHCIQLHHTAILSTKPRYMDHIIREAIEIEN
jgi:hypothetical protein